MFVIETQGHNFWEFTKAGWGITQVCSCRLLKPWITERQVLPFLVKFAPLQRGMHKIKLICPQKLIDYIQLQTVLEEVFLKLTVTPSVAWVMHRIAVSLEAWHSSCWMPSSLEIRVAMHALNSEGRLSYSRIAKETNSAGHNGDFIAVPRRRSILSI